MIRFFRFLAFSTALAVSGCATLAAEDTPPLAVSPGHDLVVAKAEPLAQTPHSRLMFHLMAAELAEGRGMNAEAARQLRAALDIQLDPQLAARATALSLAAEDLEGAVSAAELWKSADPEDLGANEVLARLYLRQGRTEDVVRVSRPLVEGHPGGRDEGYRAVALLLGQEAAGGEAALKVIETLARDDADNPAAWYAVGLIAVRYDELGVAESAARKALALSPGHRESTLLLAGVQLRQGELDEADHTLSSALEDNPDAADLRIGYAKLLLESGKIERAREQLRRSLQQRPDNADALFALSLVELERRELDAASRHLEKLIETGQRTDEAAYYLGRIAEVQDRPEAALDWYRQVQTGPQSLDAVLRTAAVQAELGHLTEARSQLERLRRQYPQISARLYGAEGEILYAAGQNGEALAMYDRALEEFPGDVDLLYGRSLVYEQLGRIGDAEADLREIIEQSPEEARALNALGYMLTVHSSRYREALSLIERAARLAPNDAAVIDSLGWVHYHLGDLQQAHDFLQRAFDRLPDPEIAAHLGEVLWQMGRRDEARQVWETALREDPDHPVLRETVGRLAR